MSEESRATLHYLHDPLCGWCWGATRLVNAAATVPNLRFELHGGGLFAGSARRPLDAGFVSFAEAHDARIGTLTGVKFADQYLQRLLAQRAVLDSEPPITAILAAGSSALAMFHAVQRAHFLQALPVSEREVLGALAAELGIDASTFNAEFSRLAGQPTSAHISRTRQLLASLGGQGYPLFSLETPAGLQRISHAEYLQKPERFPLALQAMLDAA